MRGVVGEVRHGGVKESKGRQGKGKVKARQCRGELRGRAWRKGALAKHAKATGPKSSSRGKALLAR